MNFFQYRQQVEQHRSRILQLSYENTELIHAAMKFSETEFKVWVSYIQLHDLPKLQNLSQLTQFSYSHELDISTRLAEFFGMSINILSLTQKERLEKIIEDLNLVEDEQKDLFFAGLSAKLSAKEIKVLKTKFEFLEHVVDVVDTSLFRSKEMGINKQSTSPESWFAARGMGDHAKLAQKFESVILEKILVDSLLFI